MTVQGIAEGEAEWNATNSHDSSESSEARSLEHTVVVLYFWLECLVAEDRSTLHHASLSRHEAWPRTTIATMIVNIGNIKCVQRNTENY